MATYNEYEDKETLIENPNIPDINKVKADDMNYIKYTLPHIGTSVDSSYNTNLLKSKNLFDKSTISKKNGYLKGDNGSETVDASFGYINSYILVKPNTTYTLSGTIVNSQGGSRIYYYNQGKSWISRSDNFGAGVNVCTFTTPNNCYYIQFQYMVSVFDENTIQIELGNEATTYEPFIQKSIYVEGEKFTETIGIGTSVNSANRVNVIHYGNKNIFTTTGATTGQILLNTGATQSSDSGAYTNYIEVYGNARYNIKRTDNQTLGGILSICFYNSSKTFISGTNFNSAVSLDVTTPSNAKYVRISYFASGASSYNFNCLEPSSIYVDNDEIYSKEEVLFSGNQSLSTSSTTLTLSKNPTDYSLIEIYYVKYSGSDSILSSLKISPINNGYISPQILFKATSNIIQQFWCLLKITTNTITLQDIGYVNYKISDNSVEVANNTGSFSIVKVIGYK